METDNIGNIIYLSKSVSLRGGEYPSLREGEDLSLRGGEADEAIQNRPVSQENAGTGLPRACGARNDTRSSEPTPVIVSVASVSARRARSNPEIESSPGLLRHSVPRNDMQSQTPASLRGGEADAAIQNRPISQENAVTGLPRACGARNDTRSSEPTPVIVSVASVSARRARSNPEIESSPGLLRHSVPRNDMQSQTPASLRGGEADAAIQNRPVSQENAVTGLLRHSIPRNDSVSYRKSKRRVAATIGNVLFYATLIAILIASLTYGSQNGGGILGYSMFTALSGSMEREIPEGSLIIVKHVDAENIEVGDDITFFKDANTTVTHRVMNIYEDYEGSGVRGFETKGIENPMADPDIVYADNVIGRVVYHTGNIGVAVTYVKEHIVIVSLLLIGILVLCVSLKIVFSGGKKRRPG